MVVAFDLATKSIADKSTNEPTEPTDHHDRGIASTDVAVLHRVASQRAQYHPDRPADKSPDQPIIRWSRTSEMENVSRRRRDRRFPALEQLSLVLGNAPPGRSDHEHSARE